MLDVGSGTGILCAGFYEMVRSDPPLKETQVVGIEHIDALAQSSVQNLSKSYSQELQNGNIRIVCGDGRQGYPDLAPYDGIHVGAGTPQVPKALIDQLKVGGKLVIPVGPDGNQHIFVFKKEDNKGNITQFRSIGVCYVSLTSREKQCPDLYAGRSVPKPRARK